MSKPIKAQNSAKAASKKRVVKIDASGEVRINATFNNLIIASISFNYLFFSLFLFHFILTTKICPLLVNNWQIVNLILLLYLDIDMCAKFELICLSTVGIITSERY